MSLNDTPRANRLHIGIFGRRNSGKSSLINALTGQSIAVVSDRPGTTTDPVFKSMELHPVGPVVFIDTAGFDDEGDLGALRVEKTKEIIDKTDVALILFDRPPFAEELVWAARLEAAEVPVIPVVSKADLRQPARGPAGETEQPEALTDNDKRIAAVRQVWTEKKENRAAPVLVSASSGQGLEQIRDAIAQAVPEDFKRQKIVGDLVGDGQLVLLVMPQDIQAPKGRLILPQVQTIRELLDNRCTTVCTTADRFTHSLNCLSQAPALIITDSQCFRQIHEEKPAGSRLTSFSILFAAYKGDIDVFAAGAGAIDSLTEDSRVLIAEACTHAPLEEDIGRVKIPRMLKKRFGEGLTVDVCAGREFPQDLSAYDLIIHCGACMFNRRYVLSRLAKAKAAGVPITNYGVTIAKLNGILDKVELPK